MDLNLRTLLTRWPSDPLTIAGLVVLAIVYVKGFCRLRGLRPGTWTLQRLMSFQAGLVALFVALQSPLDGLAGFLLSAHMIQHLLLMMVAPPLLLVGMPLLPLLEGLPTAIRRGWVVPIAQAPLLHVVRDALVRPVVAFVLFISMMWVWHVPAIYEAAIARPGLHRFEHVCFLVSGLLFWNMAIPSMPGGSRRAGWLVAALLFVADLHATILSGLLCFADRVIYPYYSVVPRVGGMSAVNDQALAGALMWGVGSGALIIALVAIGLRLLGTRSALPNRGPVAIPLRVLEQRRRMPGNLLDVPLLGGFLKWRHARLVAQLPLLLLAVAVVMDGLRGPPAAPLNLAGTLPWIHWRGFAIFGLLLVGNVSCMACPLTLPRKLLNRVLPAGRAWPRELRSKWLAAGLVASFFVAYESFDLWSRPAATAWLVLALFAAALVVDAVFRPGSFCKWVCPIGQFNFVQSLVSPVNVQAIDTTVCASCTGRECIRGGNGVGGCPTGLYVPHKRDGMDCTACLDCVHACPADNVGLIAATPLTRLAAASSERRGLRLDMAALVLVLCFAAFANALGMVAPVLALVSNTAARLGVARALIESAAIAVLLVALPAGLTWLASAWTRATGVMASRTEIIGRYALAFVPLAFGMWIAHYGFHFFTSAAGIVQVTSRVAADLGIRPGADLTASCACCAPPADWLLKAELIALGVAVLGSLLMAYRASLQIGTVGVRWLVAGVPWMLLLIGLYAAGVWILFQPMEMRGSL